MVCQVLYGVSARALPLTRRFVDGRAELSGWRVPSSVEKRGGGPRKGGFDMERGAFLPEGVVGYWRRDGCAVGPRGRRLCRRGFFRDASMVELRQGRDACALADMEHPCRGCCCRRGHAAVEGGGALSGVQSGRPAHGACGGAPLHPRWRCRRRGVPSLGLAHLAGKPVHDGYHRNLLCHVVRPGSSFVVASYSPCPPPPFAQSFLLDPLHLPSLHWIRSSRRR
jgi:hypothetical protein